MRAPAAVATEIDRAWRLALALCCGDEGEAEGLVEAGARRAVGGRGEPEAGWLVRGVARAHLARGGEGNDVEDRRGTTASARAVASGLALLGSLTPGQRLAVVLPRLSEVTCDGVAGLAGWSAHEADALEREGLARLTREAVTRVREGWPRGRAPRGTRASGR